MKKVLSVMTILLLAITLIACKKDDPALKLLDNASDALEMVITDPNAITTSFTVPTVLAEGVKATWKSSEAGIVSVGEESNGTVNIIVNRPLKGSGNATVTLTAELTIKAENSDEILKKEWKKVLTILESSLEVDIKNIADILALKDDKYDPSEDKDKISVTIKDATVFAVGSDAAFIYDGTGIIQVYGNKDLEVGKVYTIDGLLEWYFGIWEIVNTTATLQATATPQNPTKQTITSVQTQIEALKTAKEHLAAGKSAKDGNFEPIFATITGKVHVIPGDSSNYNTYLVDTETDVTNWKPGTLDNPADGLLFYYNTNDFAYVRTFDTFEVTMDVVIYTYRSNNNAFAVYYVGGKDGIQLGELTDEQVVKLDLASLTQPVEVLEAKEKALTLPVEGENGSEISWEQTKGAEGLVDISNGNVKMPATGQEEITLKATIKKGDSEDSKEFKIWIGAAQEMSILDARALGKGRTVIVTGVVTGEATNQTFALQDETAAIALRGEHATIRTWIGKEIKVTGKIDVYNGLVQLASTKLLTEGELPAGTNPESVDITKLLGDTDKLEPLQTQAVKVVDARAKADAAVSTSGSGDNAYEVVQLTVVVGGKEILVRSEGRLFTGTNGMKAAKAGDKVDIDGAYLSWFNNPQLSLTNANQITVTPLTDQEAVDVVAADVRLAKRLNSKGETTLALKGIQGTTITWTTESDLVTIEDDKLTVSELTAAAEITVTATVKKGEVSVVKNFTLVLSNMTTIAAFDFGTTPKTGYTAGVIELTNGNEEVISVDKNRVQGNSGNAAEHADQGVMLIFAPVNTATEAWAIFDFTDEKYKDVTRFEFALSTWNATAFNNISKLPKADLIVEALVDGEWVEVEIINLLTTLVLETHVNVGVDITQKNTKYRFTYSAPDAKKGNTTQALTLDDLTLLK